VREVYAGTQREVQEKLDDLRRRHRGGLLADAAAERQTLAAFLNAYVEAREGQLRPGTLDAGRRVFRLRVVPELGGVRLADLRPHMVQQLYGRLRRAGLAPRSVQTTHAWLRGALKWAVAWGYLESNPCDRARPPAVPRREGAPPTAGQVRDLLRAAHEAGDPYSPLWATAAATGARVGELTGLRWRDVALPAGQAKGTVRIERALLAVRGGRPVFGPPKTGASERTVALLPEAVEALRALRDARGGHFRPDDLVFVAPMGGPLDRKAISVALGRAWARAGHAPGWRFHDFRHYAATQMLEGHVEPQSVAAVLGHAKVSTTLDMYAAPRPERLAAAVDALAAGLGRGAG
jgi:integrase